MTKLAANYVWIFGVLLQTHAWSKGIFAVLLQTHAWFKGIFTGVPCSHAAAKARQAAAAQAGSC